MYAPAFQCVTNDFVMQQCPLNNATMERSVNKFRGTLAKLFVEELENMDLNAMLDDDIRELYEFIGVDVPDAEKKLRFERCVRCCSFDTMLTVKDRRESKRAAAKDDEAPAYVLFCLLWDCAEPTTAHLFVLLEVERRANRNPTTRSLRLRIMITCLR